MICSRRTSRLAVGVALAAVTSMATAGTALATENVEAKRLSGADRYATAAAIAQATFPSGSRTAVIASATNFPDALASAYLTGRLRAPVLLTAPGSLSKTTENSLSGLSVSGVTIVGGRTAVSQAVQDRLVALGYEVTRIEGADRYATARAIAETFPADFVGRLGDRPTAIVASGEGFADALAGAPISYSESFPVLLTPKASLSSHAATAMKNLGITQVILLGGSAAVSDAVEQSIESRGLVVQRVFGADRAGTAAAVADVAVDNLGWSAAHVNLARGDDFADALAGGPHEGTERAPLLLASNPSTLGTVTTGWLRDHNGTVASIDVLGGPNAVSSETVQAARQAATTPPQ